MTDLSQRRAGTATPTGRPVPVTLAALLTLVVGAAGSPAWTASWPTGSAPEKGNDPAAEETAPENDPYPEGWTSNWRTPHDGVGDDAEATATDDRVAPDPEAGGDDPLAILLEVAGAPEPEPAAEPEESELIRAVRAGEVERVTELLAAGEPVDARDGQGRTALMYAAAEGRPEVLRALLEAGADVTARDLAGSTVLFFVPAGIRAGGVRAGGIRAGGVRAGGIRAGGGEPGVARELLDRGADARVRNHLGQSALAPAALLGADALVALLLENGAGVGIDPSACHGSCGRPPLAQAVLAGHLGTARRLLEAGAPPNPDLDEGRTLLHLVAERCAPGATDLLLEAGTAVDPRTGELDHHPGETPLSVAAREGCAGVAERLLAAGADRETFDEEGFTPLLRAAKRGSAEVIEALLAGGADPDARGRDETRTTPLLRAAMEGHLEAAEALLAGGADPDAGNQRRVTPLMFAAYHGRTELARLLLEAGADPELANRDGNTPLVFAEVRGHEELVRLLLDRGADPNVVTFIEAFGEVTPLMLAAGRGHTGSTEALLAAGAEVDKVCDLKDFGRVTPLLVAADRGFDDVVEALLAAGADPTRSDEEGRTPLERAREADHPRVTTILERVMEGSTPAPAERR